MSAVVVEIIAPMRTCSKWSCRMHRLPCGLVMKRLATQLGFICEGLHGIALERSPTGHRLHRCSVWFYVAYRQSQAKAFGDVVAGLETQLYTCPLTGSIADAIQSRVFQQVVAVVIVLNAIFIGISLEAQSEQKLLTN
eukprot:5668196-Amphidinium_carterae.1